MLLPWHWGNRGSLPRAMKVTLKGIGKIVILYFTYYSINLLHHNVITWNYYLTEKIRKKMILDEKLEQTAPLSRRPPRPQSHDLVNWFLGGKFMEEIWFNYWRVVHWMSPRLLAKCIYWAWNFDWYQMIRNIITVWPDMRIRSSISKMRMRNAEKTNAFTSKLFLLMRQRTYNSNIYMYTHIEPNTHLHHTNLTPRTNMNRRDRWFNAWCTIIFYKGICNECVLLLS